MSEEKYDLIVIGGGPGGYVAAIRASQLGMKVALVERESLGGICLNWGCIPTKALLRSSEINHLLNRLGDFGFKADNIRFDFDNVVKRSRDVARKLSSGVAYLLKKNNVSVFGGAGKLAGKNKIAVERNGGLVATLDAPHIIFATGARARILPGFEPDRKFVWSYREALMPDLMPNSLVVIGSGAIGVEFASFYRNMGADVTVLEALPRILPAEDEEISGFMQKKFEEQGMRLRVSAAVTGIVKNSNSVTVVAEVEGKTERFEAEKVISAVGIVGNVENLGLENTAIKVERTHILVDEFGRTGVEGVYAIGDLTGPPWLAHKASHEGIICVEQIAGLKPHPFETLNIPSCTYCRPQVASIGMTESRAKDLGHKIRVGRFPFVGNGKAIAMGETDGIVKTIFDAETGELLGAHMAGAEVTEMIQGYVIARQLESTEEQLMDTIFPHPTISEVMHESVLDAYGKVIHF